LHLFIFKVLFSCKKEGMDIDCSFSLQFQSPKYKYFLNLCVLAKNEAWRLILLVPRVWNTKFSFVPATVVDAIIVMARQHAVLLVFVRSSPSDAAASLFVWLICADPMSTASPAFPLDSFIVSQPTSPWVFAHCLFARVDSLFIAP
jgi:hypothetical protein